MNNHTEPLEVFVIHRPNGHPTYWHAELFAPDKAKPYARLNAQTRWWLLWKIHRAQLGYTKARALTNPGRLGDDQQ